MRLLMRDSAIESPEQVACVAECFRLQRETASIGNQITLRDAEQAAELAAEWARVIARGVAPEGAADILADLQREAAAADTLLRAV